MTAPGNRDAGCIGPIAEERPMRTRRIIGLVIAIVELPLLVVGLIDPLEGGIALLGAIALGIVAWLVSRVPIPRLAWIAALATVVLGAITLGIAIFSVPVETGPDTVAAPLSGGLVVWNWLYRVGVLVTVAGWVVYLIRLVKTLRAPAVTR
jgi:hypothetical protein